MIEGQLDPILHLVETLVVLFGQETLDNCNSKIVVIK